MRKKAKKLLIFISLLILPPLIVGACALILMGLPLKTRISAHVTVSQAEFNLGIADQTHSITILKSSNFHSLAVEGFSKITISPDVLSIADPKQYLLERDTYPDTAWSPLTLDRTSINFRGIDQKFNPRITMEGIIPNLNLRLDEVRLANGSSIKMEVREESKLNLFLRRSGEAISIIPNGEFQVTADYCNLEGVTELPFQRPSQTYRVKLPTNNPTISIDPNPEILILILKLPSNSNANPFSVQPIPVTALDFTRIDKSDGQRLTALTESTEVSYPDYPDKPKFKIEASEFLILNDLKKFSINELTYKSTPESITLAIDGIAGKVTGGPRDFLRDLRVTAFDYFWYSNTLIKILAVVSWVASLTVTGYQLYREHKKNTPHAPSPSGPSW